MRCKCGEVVDWGKICSSCGRMVVSDHTPRKKKKKK